MSSERVERYDVIGPHPGIVEYHRQQDAEEHARRPRADASPGLSEGEQLDRLVAARADEIEAQAAERADRDDPVSAAREAMCERNRTAYLSPKSGRADTAKTQHDPSTGEEDTSLADSLRARDLRYANQWRK